MNRAATGILFRPGRYYQLISPIGPFPAGIYRLEGTNGTAFEFSVGKSRTVIFGIGIADPSLLREVSYRRGKRDFTRVREFTRKYYENLGELFGVDPNSIPGDNHFISVDAVTPHEVDNGDESPSPVIAPTDIRFTPFPLFDA